MAIGEGDDRGLDGWMASPTRWTWVWASSGSWWWTGKPGMPQSMGSQRIRHNWTELIIGLNTGMQTDDFLGEMKWELTLEGEGNLQGIKSGEGFGKMAFPRSRKSWCKGTGVWGPRRSVWLIRELGEGGYEVGWCEFVKELAVFLQAWNWLMLLLFSH